MKNMSASAIWALMAIASSAPIRSEAKKPKQCKDYVEMPDYGDPIFAKAMTDENGKCPEGFDAIPIEEFPCRQFLRFATTNDEIIVECPATPKKKSKTKKSKKSAKPNAKADNPKGKAL
jgi:hypothetical protein